MGRGERGGGRGGMQPRTASQPRLVSQKMRILLPSISFSRSRTHLRYLSSSSTISTCCLMRWLALRSAEPIRTCVGASSSALWERGGRRQEGEGEQQGPPRRGGPPPKRQRPHPTPLPMLSLCPSPPPSLQRTSVCYVVLCTGSLRWLISSPKNRTRSRKGKGRHMVHQNIQKLITLPSSYPLPLSALCLGTW